MRYNLCLVLQTEAVKRWYLGKDALYLRGRLVGLETLDLSVDCELAHFDLSQLWLDGLGSPCSLEQLTKRVSL